MRRDAGFFGLRTGVLIALLTVSVRSMSDEELDEALFGPFRGEVADVVEILDRRDEDWVETHCFESDIGVCLGVWA